MNAIKVLRRRRRRSRTARSRISDAAPQLHDPRRQRRQLRRRPMRTIVRRNTLPRLRQRLANDNKDHGIYTAQRGRRRDPQQRVLEQRRLRDPSLPERAAHPRGVQRGRRRVALGPRRDHRLRRTARYASRDNVIELNVDRVLADREHRDVVGRRRRHRKHRPQELRLGRAGRRTSTGNGLTVDREPRVRSRCSSTRRAATTGLSASGACRALHRHRSRRSPELDLN